MALSVDALTTAAAVFDELTLADDGGVLLARIERYIEAASAWAAKQCNRRFSYLPAVVEDVVGVSGQRLYVGRAPIVSVATVVAGGVELGDWSVLDADAGLLWRRGGWVDEVKVTYAGGWVTPTQAAVQALPRTLPHDLEDAIVQLVVSRASSRGRDGRIASESHETSTYTWAGAPLPPGVAAVLASYTRVAGG